VDNLLKQKSPKVVYPLASVDKSQDDGKLLGKPISDTNIDDEADLVEVVAVEIYFWQNAAQKFGVRPGVKIWVQAKQEI
jgi:hypothetical protein